MTKRPMIVNVSIILLLVPVLMMFVNIILNGWIMVRSAAVFTIVIMPFIFLIYRLAQADRVARLLVSLTVFFPLYVVYFYVRIFFASEPEHPDSLAWQATMGMMAPSKLLPVLVPTIGFLIGAILLWLPSGQLWYADHESRNDDETGDV